MKIGQAEYPVEYLVGLVLAVIIVFANQIPDSYKAFTDSLGGRIVGIVGVVAVLRYFGWVYALLAALAFMSLLRAGVHVRGAEGFADAAGVEKKAVSKAAEGFEDAAGAEKKAGGKAAEGYQGQKALAIQAGFASEGYENQIVKERIGKRWYVERVLGENPELIDTDVVTTSAVSDSSQRSM
jgi:hypothetical protein